MFSDIDLTKEPSEYTLDEIQEMVTLLKRFSGNFSEYYTYENILKRMLDKVPDDMDKRVGSIIYDALAPCAAELAEEYIEIQIYKDQTYVLTAIGDNLDTIGNNYSIPRLEATYAERIAQFTDTNDNLINLAIGSRFAVPDSDSNITYTLTKQLETGKAILTCEQEGVIGNEYSGAILPLFTITNLKEAKIISTQTPARDKEDDESYRARIIEQLNSKGFAGNIRAYKDLFINEITGASEPKVYPVWKGGGTVKVSVLDSQYNPITDEFKTQIKEKIDPEEFTGQGVGLAPIGHQVTIDTPTKYPINIKASLDLDGVVIGNIQKDVEDNLEDYLLSIRKDWVDNEKTSVFKSQIIATILETKGIKNVTNVLLNDEDADINLVNTAEEQFVPVLGTVTLTEVGTDE